MLLDHVRMMMIMMVLVMMMAIVLGKVSGTLNVRTKLELLGYC